jgi:hypothetical protein
VINDYYVELISNNTGGTPLGRHTIAIGGKQSKNKGNPYLKISAINKVRKGPFPYNSYEPKSTIELNFKKAKTWKWFLGDDKALFLYINNSTLYKIDYSNGKIEYKYNFNINLSNISFDKEKNPILTGTNAEEWIVV